jgi:hypothetical protein
VNVRQIYAAILLAAGAQAAMGQDALAPPAGARKVFEFGARGVQIYVCKETGQDQAAQAFAWTFDAPEAVLFEAGGKKAGTHSKGPSWTLDDGSMVTAALAAKAPAPRQGSVPWLLLKVTSHSGQGKLDGVSFIRRVDTEGGAEPQSGCDAAHEGNIARIPYTATYQFFGP